MFMTLIDVRNACANDTQIFVRSEEEKRNIYPVSNILLGTVAFRSMEILPGMLVLDKKQILVTLDIPFNVLEAWINYSNTQYAETDKV